MEPGTHAHQALLSHFMLKSTALSSKTAMQDFCGHDASEVTAGSAAAQQKPAAGGRGYRSQPSSPARTRREFCSDWVWYQLFYVRSKAPESTALPK